MPKNSWNDYSTTAASNTDVHSVSIAEGMAPSDVNNALREIMTDTANFDQGNVTLTSALAVASGGTGAATHTANNVLVGAGTGAVTSVAPSTSGNVLTSNGTVWQSTTPAGGGSKPNLIRNSDFKVWQRGTSFASPTSHDYSADGWKFQWESTYNGRVTITKDTTGIFTAWGSHDCMKIDCTTADGSVGTNDMAVVYHPIEAQDLQQLEFGAAGARTMSLSFLFRSPKSGAHTVALYQQDANRVRTFDFTVASADTAERITIEGITGDTSGTIANDTGQGLQLIFPFASGSGRQADASAGWASGYAVGTGNQQNLLDDVATNVFIGQVKLEANATSSDYIFDDYETALAKSQRYFWRATDGGVNKVIGAGVIASTSIAGIVAHYPVPMRTTPTQTDTTPTQFYIHQQGVAYYATAVSTTGYENEYGMFMQVTSGNTLTVGSGAILTVVSGAILDFSAEL